MVKICIIFKKKSYKLKMILDNSNTLGMFVSYIRRSLYVFLCVGIPMSLLWCVNCSPESGCAKLISNSPNDVTIPTGGTARFIFTLDPHFKQNRWISLTVWHNGMNLSSTNMNQNRRARLILYKPGNHTFPGTEEKPFRGTTFGFDLKNVTSGDDVGIYRLHMDYNALPDGCNFSAKLNVNDSCTGLITSYPGVKSAEINSTVNLVWQLNPHDHTTGFKTIKCISNDNTELFQITQTNDSQLNVFYHNGAKTSVFVDHNVLSFNLSSVDFKDSGDTFFLDLEYDLYTYHCVKEKGQILIHDCDRVFATSPDDVTVSPEGIARLSWIFSTTKQEIRLLRLHQFEQDVFLYDVENTEQLSLAGYFGTPHWINRAIAHTEFVLELQKTSAWIASNEFTMTVSLRNGTVCSNALHIQAYAEQNGLHSQHLQFYTIVPVVCIVVVLGVALVWRLCRTKKRRQDTGVAVSDGNVGDNLRRSSHRANSPASVRAESLYCPLNEQAMGYNQPTTSEERPLGPKPTNALPNIPECGQIRINPGCADRSCSTNGNPNEYLQMNGFSVRNEAGSDGNCYLLPVRAEGTSQSRV